MSKNTIQTEELKTFVSALIDSGVEIYGVQQKDHIFGKFHYSELKNAEHLRLDYDVTLTPPKKYFTPEKETLLNFKISPEPNIQPVFETNRRILIGVHPYDMIAINQMDEVWRDKNEDAHYFKRRNNTIIIGVDPQKASSWAFWCLMDASTVDKGYDIWLTKLDDNTYFVETASESGNELLNKFAKTEIAEESDIIKRDSIRMNLHKICSSERSLSARTGEIYSLMKANEDHPIWEEKAKKCYSCGSCNIICPTCYCFDVTDEVGLDMTEGKRIRFWDGCQLENFAKVATGENFRRKRVERYKHRFYRKTVYQFEKYNHLACVGCGRCSSVCLPNIADPLSLINAVKETRI